MNDVQKNDPKLAPPTLRRCTADEIAIEIANDAGFPPPPPPPPPGLLLFLYATATVPRTRLTQAQLDDPAWTEDFRRTFLLERNRFWAAHARNLAPCLDLVRRKRVPKNASPRTQSARTQS